MFGLIALMLIFGWLIASIAIARGVGKLLPLASIRFLVTALLAPTLFVLPFADELVGKFQFDRLCEEAKEISIHGTIPMGVELYRPGGEWRSSDRDISLQEVQRIDAVTEALVRWDHGEAAVVPGWIPVITYETKIFDRRDGRLLASYRFFSTPGGWIGRRLEKPLVVRNQCSPEKSKLYEKIFPFESRKSDKS